MEANRIMRDPSSTDEDLKKAKEKVIYAYTNILKSVDAVQLQNLIDQKVKEKDYTKESYKAYKDALEKAKKAAAVKLDGIEERDKTLEGYKVAKENLQKAIDKLVKKDNKTQKDDKNDKNNGTLVGLVNKDKLAEAIKNNQEGLDQYTEQSKKEMQNALDEAQKVLDDKSSSQEDVDKAIENIENAKGKLVKKLNPTTSKKVVGNSVDNKPNSNTKGSLPQTGEVALGIVLALSGLGAGGFGLYKTRKK